MIVDVSQLTPGDDPKAKLDAAAYAKYQANYREYSSNGWKQASLVDWLDSVDYAVRLIGIDHVGLSSDFTMAAVSPATHTSATDRTSRASC